MNQELIAVADAWRAIMPLVPHEDMPDVHPRLVRDIYPLTVSDVYTRTYACLMSPDVPKQLKQPVTVALGQTSHRLHTIHTYLPQYTYTDMDRHNHWAWTKAHQGITDNGSQTLHTQAGASLFNIGIFLASGNDTIIAQSAADELLYTLGRNHGLPATLADLVTTAEPYIA